MSTEKFNIIIKDYPEELKLSETKRTIWYHKSEGDKLPKSILSAITSKDESKYKVDKDGWVVDANTGFKVVRNSKTAGKPNMQKINGQSIWNGEISRFSRSKLKNYLEAYFTPFIIRQLPPNLFTSPEKYFHFEFIFYSPIELRGFSKMQDIDNHALPYTKSFIDTLVKLKVITDDSTEFYRGCYSRYVSIDTEEERRLEVKIHFCKNEETIKS